MRLCSSLFLLLIAGCAAPSSRIADGLGRYGIDSTHARCVGDRLQARLSIGQLQQLGRAAKAYAGDGPVRTLNPADLMRAAGQIDDPQVPLEVAKAGLVCGLVQ